MISQFSRTTSAIVAGLLALAAAIAVVLILARSGEPILIGEAAGYSMPPGTIWVANNASNDVTVLG